jgi:nicotinamide mononucleotide transporter
MLDTALTLFGTPVTWLEVLAFVFALANIACNVFEIHWGWPLTVVASGLYAWLFFTSKLYGEAGVNVFFAVTAVWGWSQWLKGQYDDGETPLVIRRLTRRGAGNTIIAWAVLWIVCAALLHTITDSDVVWADGFVTAGSIVGTYLLARKYIANWPVWLLVNAASIALFAYKGLTLTVVLYVIFFGLAIWGWIGWHRRMIEPLRAPTHAAD